LKLKEAWKLSKTPYTELTFRSLELTRGSSRGIGSSANDPVKRVRSVLRGAKISKVAFSIFIGIGSVVPFLAFAARKTPYTLATAIILSLAITLAYSVAYSLQVLPSFAQAGPYSLLQSLPIDERDFSLISVFSFLRTFDYIALTAIFVQVLSVAVFTSSFAGTALMAVASLINLAFGMAIAVWLSSVFYKNVTRGSRSRAASVARFVFLLTWSSVTLLFTLLFNFLSYLIPYFDSILAGNFSSGAGILLAFLHPFSEAILISSIVFASSPVQGTLYSITPLIYAATLAYIFLSAVAARRTLKTISIITHGQLVRITRQITRNFELKLRQPMMAYIVKDLRVASKSPQAAFLFALPLFETLIIALSSSGLSLLGSSSIVAITSIGTFFTLFAASVLLNTEGLGLEYTMTLPLGSRIIIFAKSTVATIAFLPVPIAILILTALKGTVQGTVAIPFVEVLAVSAATTAQLGFFITTQKRSRTGIPLESEGAFQPSGFSVMSGGDVVRLVKALIVGGIVLFAPLASYEASSTLGNSDGFSILIMAVSAVAELVIVQFLLRRSAYR
jgi:predicted permease